MVRLNIFLLLALVICSLGVVTSQHKARKIFQALEAEQERARQLEVEFGQLQIELSTWGAAPRIEKIAREKAQDDVHRKQARAIACNAPTGGHSPNDALQGKSGTQVCRKPVAATAPATPGARA
jgi:cell division protein FtsL